MLAWSFSRDERMGTDTAATRKNRNDLAELARPQFGVDALKGQFGRPTTDIPSVVNVAREADL